MISPEIWESQSFGELSLLAKVLFIGMISQADDDGKGVLSPQLLKSKILPYDELRIADIDKALKEIGHNASVAESADADKAREERGHKMSVVYYEVGGKQYYCFENWRKWQTINRPIPSKLPNPPDTDWVRGGVHSHETITDNSMNTHTQFSECSRPIEDIKRNEYLEVSKKDKEIDKSMGITRAYARESYKELMDAHEIPERVQLELWRFIQHCHANGQVITNDRLRSLWFKLKKLYHPSDISGMVQAIRTAIDKGYYDIKDGKGWIAESIDAMRAAGVKPPGGVDEEDE